MDKKNKIKWNNKFRVLGKKKGSRQDFINLRKKLEEAMSAVDKFGTDARSITRTLENIKDPGQIEIAAENENVEKFEHHSKQLKN